MCEQRKHEYELMHEQVHMDIIISGEIVMDSTMIQI